MDEELPGHGEEGEEVHRPAENEEAGSVAIVDDVG